MGRGLYNRLTIPQSTILCRAKALCRIRSVDWNLQQRSFYLKKSCSCQPGSRVLATAANPTGQPALLVEVDGVVLDMHMDGHRVAFNKAFADLGLECANWSHPVYNDLLQQADGSGERMVMTFFNMTGWPLTVPTNEQGIFSRKVICSVSTFMTLPRFPSASACIPPSIDPAASVDDRGRSTVPASSGTVPAGRDETSSTAQQSEVSNLPPEPLSATPPSITQSGVGCSGVDATSGVLAALTSLVSIQQPVPAASLRPSDDDQGQGVCRPLLPDERLQLVQQVLEIKQRMLRRMLSNGQVPLRPGVEGILDAAMEAGTPVALLAGTLSEREDDAAGCALRLLGPERAGRIQLFSAFPSELVEGDEAEEEDGPSSTFDGSMAMAAAKMKKREAANFVRVLKEAREGLQKSGVDVVLDGNLAGSVPSSVSSAWLVALAALLGSPVASCMVLAASGPVIRAAQGAGMVPVAIPRQFAARADFPGARAKFESMGPGAATWGKLSALLNQSQQR